MLHPLILWGQFIFKYIDVEYVMFKVQTKHCISDANDLHSVPHKSVTSMYENQLASQMKYIGFWQPPSFHLNQSMSKHNLPDFCNYWVASYASWHRWKLGRCATIEKKPSLRVLLPPSQWYELPRAATVALMKSSSSLDSTSTR